LQFKASPIFKSSYLGKTLHKRKWWVGAGRVAQDVGPEFKPQYHNNNKSNKT
jgi:hypothetical protein